MEKKDFFLVVVLLCVGLLPSVDANMALPWIDSLYLSMGTILLIPIILIETLSAYFIARILKKYKLSFMSALVIFLLANIVSTIIGFIIVQDTFNPLELENIMVRYP